ncbi:MAG: zinc-ribbon and DUF3426 domain-containing protein [Gammaproteobacteria bacterium]
MYTLCPHCDTVHRLDAGQLARANGRVSCGHCGHRLDAGQLARANGRVSCGHCGKAFNALRHLHDDFPDARAARRRPEYSTQPPVLGADTTAAQGAAPARAPDATDTRSRRPSSVAWWGLAIVLAVLAIASAGWALRDHVPPDGALAGWLQAMGAPGFEPPGAYRDPRRIHLVARDLHSHPTRPGVLVLSATFVNLADRAQPYPVVAVTLLDPDNAPLVARAFEPDEYLAGDAGAPGALAPGQHVPVLLEFADPGEKAVGFEIAFR